MSTSVSFPTTPEEVALRVAAALSAADTYAATTSDDVPLLMVEASNAAYAFPVREVREIVPFAGATRVPGAPAHVIGLINRRGSIITVLDLGRCAPGEPVVGVGRRERVSVVLVDHGPRVVGFLVDSVLDIRNESVDCVRAATASMGPGQRGARLNASTGEIVFLLNVPQILNDALQREGEQ